MTTGMELIQFLKTDTPGRCFGTTGTVYQPHRLGICFSLPVHLFVLTSSFVFSYGRSELWNGCRNGAWSPPI